MDHENAAVELHVPDLDLPRDLPPPRPQEARPVVVDEPSIELAEIPSRHVATGVRSRPCPVCQTELPLSQRVCQECGERLYDEEALMTSYDPRSSPYPLARGPMWPVPRETSLAAPFFSAVADTMPMGVAKRLLLYPLLAAFFCNLLVPCRFHETGLCLVLALVGLVGVVANGKTSRG